jgi:beta-lactamase superfamily II metal-dependent hydrolase
MNPMTLFRTCCLVSAFLVVGGEGFCQATPEGFPVATQFSPVPSGKGWKGEEGPLSPEILRDTVDNIREHGFTGIEAPTHRPAEEEAVILEYAQSKGMFVTYHAGALEGFGRTDPPEICVYSPEYSEAVRARAEKQLAPLKDIPNLYNAFIYQDEPFHWGPQSFGYNTEVQAEFKKRHGYELPSDLDSVQGDPRKWQEVIDFRSGYFPDGWRQVHPIVKDINPNFKTIMTHDSHNTFGAGYSSHSEIAIDDVFHWGGDFSDMFVFDIYPYMSMDFRFGRLAQLAKPRISQTHYSFAQMRNLTRAHDKELGFWVGTYNPAWFPHFLGPELEDMPWSEREMSMTAVAQGADFLLTGYKIPIDPGHWEAFGEGLRLLQKAGAPLLDAPKIQAKACMLFPRTQYIQLQQEYFNVGISFELFLRAFGELDILHEDQVTDDGLSGYELLLLFDVELLPEKVAKHIASFVRKGGTLIADCVPRLNANRQPMAVMEEVFGVQDTTGDRIRRMGHWIPYITQAPIWANRPENFPDESVCTTDALKGEALGTALDLTLVSPRTCTVTTGQVLASTASNQPAVIHRKVGQGQAFLLGFCLQDTYFKTWEDGTPDVRAQLRALLRGMTQAAGIRPHVYSSNPDIEAAVRANEKEGFLFVINHESTNPETTIRMADLPFPIGEITDLESGKAVPFSREEKGGIKLQVSAPLGEVRLCRLTPNKAAANTSFTLWQLPNQTPTQMMSYVLRTTNGRIIVIDGGNAGDGPYLADFLNVLGNMVDAWIITHAHSDHFNALREILKQPGELEIKALYGSLPSQAWVNKVGSDGEKKYLREFNEVVAQAGHAVSDLALGQVLEIDGVRLTVLGVKNPEITANPVNNSSLVLRVYDGHKSILFLGDLGVEGGEKLLNGPMANRLQADYVQMAHHGQAGVNEAFYQRVNPAYCLWPAPKWLWDNDKGGGKGSGPWRTLEVRAWMEKLSIKTHYPMFEGIHEID